ncbi:hypothetical protein DsansV1_C09g0092071 [Dioscorea sansibarensis]
MKPTAMEGLKTNLMTDCILKVGDEMRGISGEQEKRLTISISLYTH